MRKRLQTATLCVTLVLCAAAAAACVAYWQAGGDAAALADAIVRTVQGEGMPAVADAGVWQEGIEGALGFGGWLRQWAVARVSSDADAPVTVHAAPTSFPDDPTPPAIIEPPMDLAEPAS